MGIPFSSFLFLIGLGIGSFFNVVALRYSPERFLFSWRALRGRSRCDFCGKKLAWFELIPLLSFFVQKGRCRKCGQFLSWQYPLAELTAGLIAAFVPLRSLSFFQENLLIFQGGALIWLVAFLTIVILFLLLAALVDLKHFVIPDEIILTLALFGFGVVLVKNFFFSPELPVSFLGHYSLLFAWTRNVWTNHIFGIFIAGLPLALLTYLSKEKAMGWGDVKLAAVLGWILGWPDILLAIALSFVIGGATGLILILAKKKKMKSFVPFGPFLFIGTGLTVFLGSRILDWYFSIFL